MELFKATIDGTLKLFQTPFTLFGFSLSFWQVFLFTIVMAIIAYIIWRLFDG